MDWDSPAEPKGLGPTVYDLVHRLIGYFADIIMRYQETYPLMSRKKKKMTGKLGYYTVGMLWGT